MGKTPVPSSTPTKPGGKSSYHADVPNIAYSSDAAVICANTLLLQHFLKASNLYNFLILYTSISCHMDD